MSSKPLEHELRMGKVVRSALHSGSLSSNPVEHEIRLVICETVNLHFPALAHTCSIWIMVRFLHPSQPHSQRLVTDTGYHPHKASACQRMRS